MNNNKKLTILIALLAISFLLLFFFPSVNSKIIINFYNFKNFIYKPVEVIGIKIINYKNKIDLNNNNLSKISQLKREVKNLTEINNSLIIALSKFNELNEILFNQHEDLPKSVGVKIIGNKNHLIANIFVINKGYNFGISKGDYLINKKYIIGRVKEVNNNGSEVVGILNTDYGEEVLIGSDSYIVSGTNKNYLNFIRKKNTTKKMNLKIGETAKVKVGNVYLELGIVQKLNGNYIIKPNIKNNYSTARVILND